MKRILIVMAVLSVLLLADGMFMEISHYHPADQNNFFGNQNVILSDGAVVLISGGFFTLATLFMWLVSLRRRAGR